MAVFQQVIKDEVPGTPGGSGLTEAVRGKANKGFLLAIASDQATANKSAYGSAVCRLTNAVADVVCGVFCDYHNSRQMSVGTKGRFYIATSRAVVAADLGKGIRPSPPGTGNVDIGKGRPNTGASAVGEIVGYGSQTDGNDPIGDYAIVDLNLP